MAKPSCRGRLRCPCEHCQLESQGARAREHQLINQLVAILDERSRRLSVASLALQQGRGGLTQLARITGLSRNTIRRGIHELLTRQQIESKITQVWQSSQIHLL
jgi:DNA-binding phage protein